MKKKSSEVCEMLRKLSCANAVYTCTHLSESHAKAILKCSAGEVVRADTNKVTFLLLVVSLCQRAQCFIMHQHINKLN